MNRDELHNYHVDLTEKEVIDYILSLSQGYRDRQEKGTLYTDSDEVPENIISLYLYYINFVAKKNFKVIIKDYKEAFIFNESIIDPGVTECERIGLGLVYDYLGSYDFSKDPNMFIDGLRIHCLLFSACPYPEFGGKLRQVPVKLKGLDYTVPEAEDARREFQELVTTTPVFSREHVFDYIDTCIKYCARMVAVQPFQDGNKRTFRAVLNLMLGKAGIPPIYILPHENEVYKRALYKAMKDGDYNEIIRFYYYKICDSIVDLSFKECKKPWCERKPFVLLFKKHPTIPKY